METIRKEGQVDPPLPFCLLNAVYETTPIIASKMGRMNLSFPPIE